MEDSGNSISLEVVLSVPRFWQCLSVLVEFMESDTPPEVVVQIFKSFILIYGFGDTSGLSFGMSLQIHGEIKYRIGTQASNESR